MRTLLLDRDRWDLVKDAAGNIAVADLPYAAAQDAASAVRLFRGELYFDSARGIPYLRSATSDGLLGTVAPLEFYRSAVEEAARAVPAVVRAKAVFTGLTARALSGQLQVTLEDATVLAVDFGG